MCRKTCILGTGGKLTLQEALSVAVKPQRAVLIMDIAPIPHSSQSHRIRDIVVSAWHNLGERELSKGRLRKWLR